MLSFFKLIRIPNLIIIALIQYLIRWGIMYPILKFYAKNTGVDFQFQMSNFHFGLIVLATVLLAAAAYVINDYFDRKIDTLNRPDEVIVGKEINRRFAMTIHMILNFVAVALGFFVAWKYGMYKLGFIFLLVPGILWFYSTTFKRQLFVGNFVVAFLVAMIPLIIPFYEIPILHHVYHGTLIKYNTDFNNILSWVAGFSFLAFMMILILEIVKDMRDFEGDREFGVASVPVSLGMKTSKIIVITLSLITSLTILWLIQKHLNDKLTYIYSAICFFMPQLFLIVKIVFAKKYSDYVHACWASRFVLFSGVSYIFIAHYNIVSKFGLNTPDFLTYFTNLWNSFIGII